jgi:hypothetical protein
VVTWETGSGPLRQPVEQNYSWSLLPLIIIFGESPTKTPQATFLKLAATKLATALFSLANTAFTKMKANQVQLFSDGQAAIDANMLTPEITSLCAELASVTVQISFARGKKMASPNHQYHQAAEAERRESAKKTRLER